MIPSQSFAASDIGLVRSENEDSYLLYIPEDKDLVQRKGILAIVADGLGGGPAGKLASSMAVELVKEFYYDDPGEDNLTSLKKSLQMANLEIYKEAQRDPGLRGMATTCTALVAGQEECFLGHIGDSRAYLLRRKELRQISENHSLVYELVREGIISREEARYHPQRNIILKALGSVRHIEPDASRFAVEAGDTLLLCSDGLHGYLSDEEISFFLQRYPVEKAGHKMIKLALDKGGADNITVVIMRI